VEPFEEVLRQVVGFIYPNEVELHWGLLIVIYPYVTGLVAGAFILASLVRVFNVKELQPTYRLALLTALAYLIVAPIPLLAHLGRPERAFEIFLTPNLHSAMAMFGFVYAWYLMVVLLLEIWLDYRKDLVLWAKQETGLRRWLHWGLTLGATDLSPRALRFDDSAGRIITIIGIPSAFLLHGYVGFIFGSADAYCVPLLGYRLWHRSLIAFLPVGNSAPLQAGRHEVPGQVGGLSLLRSGSGLFPRDARLHPPALRSGGVNHHSFPACL
jgi:predicted membrane protein